MSAELLTGNAAAAWGARLCDVDYVPAFPITPQTEIIEALAAWIDSGQMPGRLTMLESEHSMMTAAGAAAASGARVFTATSSQGLLYAMEMLYAVAGWHVPLVLVNVSRGVAAPITLESDHCDVLSARDSGFLQLHAASCQEVLDLVLLGYRVAEDPRVRLPVIVNLDGFYLSFTREPVVLPEPAQVASFLPPFDPGPLRFRAGEPVSQAVAVLGGGPYSYFRYQTHLAALAAEQVFVEHAARFEQLFGRRREPLERYHADDAELVFVMMGAFSSKAKDAVDRLRARGERVGLVRICMLRPFPAAALRVALAGKQAAIVVDQNVSLGKGGVLHAELCSVLYGERDAPRVLTSFVGALGGRDIKRSELFEMVAVTREAVRTGVTPPPRLLYRSAELRELRALQAIAHVEHVEHGEEQPKR